MPVGDWLWPAIWLLPKRSKYGQWPASGEIGNALKKKFFHNECMGSFKLV